MSAPARIGRYELLERIGRGALGEVYLGRDTMLGREVAVKLMAADSLGDEPAKARFFREAKAAARLQHANIATVFEFGEHDETPFIVMEYLRGETLAARLHREPRVECREAVEIAIQLCAGLEFAHERRILHRDIRPANVWLCQDGTVKLLDFGLANLSSSNTMFTEAATSAPYLSPEQVTGRDLDAGSDVFSTGVVLYELLCGSTPFGGDSPTAVMLAIVNEAPALPPADLSPDLSQAVLHALEKDPDRRYARARDFGADLEAAALSLRLAADTTMRLNVDTTRAGSDVETRPGTPAASKVEVWALPPWMKRRDVRRGGLAAFGVTALLLVGYVAWPRGAAEPKRIDINLPLVPPEQSAKPSTSLRITSVPPGAAIRVDGRPAGLTPTEIDVTAKNRPRRVRVDRDGYQSAEVEITPAIIDKGVLALDLLPRVAERLVTLIVTGAYPFEVLESGRVRSAESDHHELRIPATSRLRMYSDAVFLDRSVALDSGKDRVTVNAPRLGSISVNATGRLERCRVFIDDKFADSVPVRCPIVSGGHRVRLRCPQGDTAALSVTIVENQETPVNFPATTELVNR